MKKFLNKETFLLLIIVLLVIWNVFNTKSVRTDVKGYKDKIIKGCQNSLKKIHFMEAEIMLDNVYKNF